MLTRGHLEAYLEVVERRSIQAAARETGRSRATYNRYLKELREAFDTSELLRRAPGQREGVLTPEGQKLAEQARRMLQQWDQWLAQTKDAISTARRSVRVGALAGAFDLIVDLLGELRDQDPTLPLKVVEYSQASLLDGVASGAVDLAFGNALEVLPAHIELEVLGPLEWAVIVPEDRASEFEQEIALEDLDGVPMVVAESGPAREILEATFGARGLRLEAAFEVGSTPRIVEMVERGFGVAIVSRFRTAFLPPKTLVRPLIDGPAPLTAGVFTRSGTNLSEAATDLVQRARQRFFELSTG